MNTTKESPHGTNRKTATIVGVLYIIGTVAGVLSMVVWGAFWTLLTISTWWPQMRAKSRW